MICCICTNNLLRIIYVVYCWSHRDWPVTLILILFFHPLPLHISFLTSLLSEIGRIDLLWLILREIIVEMTNFTIIIIFLSFRFASRLKAWTTPFTYLGGIFWSPVRWVHDSTTDCRSSYDSFSCIENSLLISLLQTP